MTGAAFSIGALAPLDLLAIGVGLVAFLVVLALSAGLLRRDPLAARIEAAALPLEARGLDGPGTRAEAKAGALAVMRRVVERLNLMRSRQAERVADKLANAGWRSKDALVVYLFAKLASPLIAGGAGGAALFLMPTLESGLATRLILLMAGVLGASYLPDLFVRRRAAVRRRLIARSLPDALDLLVICAEAGLSLDAGLGRVAREIAPSSRPLADELALTTFELGFLPERRTTLDNLCRRVDLPAVRSLATPCSRPRSSAPRSPPRSG